MGMVTINADGQMVYLADYSNEPLVYDATQMNALSFWTNSTERATAHEGSGARNFDGPEPPDRASEIAAHQQEMLRQYSADSVAAAMTAMHAQRRSDGRPVPYLPEEKV